MRRAVVTVAALLQELEAHGVDLMRPMPLVRLATAPAARQVPTSRGLHAG